MAEASDRIGSTDAIAETSPETEDSGLRIQFQGPSLLQTPCDDVDVLKRENAELMHALQLLNEDTRDLDVAVRGYQFELETEASVNAQLRLTILQLQTSLQRHESPKSTPVEVQLDLKPSEANKEQINALDSKIERLEKELDAKIDRIDSLSSKCTQYQQTLDVLLSDDTLKANCISDLEAKIHEFELGLLDQSSDKHELEEKLQNSNQENLYQKEQFTKVRQQHVNETLRLNEIILEYSDEKSLLVRQAKESDFTNIKRIDTLSKENENLIAQLNELSLRHIAMNEEKVEATEQLQNEQKKFIK